MLGEDRRHLERLFQEDGINEIPDDSMALILIMCKKFENQLMTNIFLKNPNDKT